MKKLIKLTVILFTVFLIYTTMASKPISYIPQNVLYSHRNVYWQGNNIAQELYVAGTLNYSKPQCLKVRGSIFVCFFRTIDEYGFLQRTTCRISSKEMECWTILKD